MKTLGKVASKIESQEQNSKEQSEDLSDLIKGNHTKFAKHVEHVDRSFARLNQNVSHLEQRYGEVQQTLAEDRAENRAKFEEQGKQISLTWRREEKLQKELTEHKAEFNEFCNTQSKEKMS
jgi:septation ring formation regulator EzrA